jgi:glycine/D-amino acid oxidase-like deaminating enzyme/nitrite reductase/ring-hydroxylating ferredoxin subunit
MKSNVEESVSLWMATAKAPFQPALTSDLTTDVCIVGAGMAGLTTAYLLAREGRRVVVLDDGPVAGGQSQRTTAHLSNELGYAETEEVHGSEGSQIAAAAHSAAIDRIESIVAAESIACDFERLDGYLFVPPGESTDILEKERGAAQRAGLRDVEFVARAPLPFDTGRCLRFPRQGQFHPLKYFAGLAAAIERLGGRVYSGSHAASIEGGSPARITIEGGPTVTAGAVVVATNVPVNDLLAIHTKQAPYLTYVIGARIPAGSVARGLFCDTERIYHYIRLQPGGDGTDMLIVGGEDHKAGQATDQQQRWQRLEEWSRERFSMMKKVEYRWSGMVMETIDGLAFIGRNPLDSENVYVATGDCGMGMTHGTIAGILITDLIQGRENPWSKLFDPSRKPVFGMAWKEYLIENANVAQQYVKDWLGGGDVRSSGEIAPGSGAIVREGLTKVAVFRDEQGHYHRRSALCPHLGCIVHWNGAEKTWDCPCHGSRFDSLGAVINGPANSSLPEQA